MGRYLKIERIRRLLVAKKLEIATEEELRELERLLADEPEMAAAGQALNNDNKISDKYYAWKRDQGQMAEADSRKPERKAVLFLKYAVAAAIAIAAGAGIYFWQKDDTKSAEGLVAERVEAGTITFPEAVMPEVETVDLRKAAFNEEASTDSASGEEAFLSQAEDIPADGSGQKAEMLKTGDKDFLVILEDGTEVHLGYDSKLVFPEHFRGAKREVRLSGEAFVKVAKSKKPFYIHTASGTIRQYGTSFHVSAKPGSGATEVVLVEGSVGVYTGNGEGEPDMMLKPGQKAVIEKEILVKEVDTLPYRAWAEGAIEFGYISLDRLLSVASVWYGVEISDPSGLASSEYLTGSLRRTSPIEDILTALSEISGVTLSLSEGTVTVNPD